MQRGELCYSYGGGAHLGQLRAHLSLRAGMPIYGCMPTLADWLSAHSAAGLLHQRDSIRCRQLAHDLSALRQQ